MTQKDTKQSLITINNSYLNKEKSFLTSNDATLPMFDVSNPQKVFDGLTNNAKNAIDALNTVKLNTVLNQNEMI
ncbi:MAG: hypothetical protein RSB95_05215 [Bacilli bacterium]